MPSALPPVTDCGCASSTSSGGGGTGDLVSGACCPLSGVNDPNFDGLIPVDVRVRTAYLQLADLVAGPVVQVWYWNIHLLVWQ